MSDKPAVPTEDGEDLDLEIEPDVETEIDPDLEPETDPDLEPEVPAEPGNEEPAAARPSRAQTRIQTLRERAEKAEREAAELRGFRQALEQRPAAPIVDYQAQQQRQMQALQERWNEMAMNGQYGQAMQEALQWGTTQTQNALMQQQVLINDRIDKQAYDAEARTSRPHQRHRAEVERILADQRARNNLAITREDILLRLVGQEAIANANRAAPQQRRQATARVAAQQTRPGGARGDSPAGNRRPAPGTPEHDDLLLDEYFRSGGTL